MCCTYTLGYVAFPGGWFREGHRREDSGSPRSCHVQWMHSEGWDFMPTSPLHAEILFGLSWHWSAACCFNCCESVCTAVLLYPENTVSFFPSTSFGFYNLSVPLSTKILSGRGSQRMRSYMNVSRQLNADLVLFIYF